MTEAGESSPPAVTETFGLPDISSFGKIAGLDIPKQTKDTIYSYWQSFGQSSQSLEHFKEVSKFKTIPPLEQAQALKAAEYAEHKTREINSAITELVDESRIERFINILTFTNNASYAEEISDDIRGFNNDKLGRDQIVALLEAIDETSGLGLAAAKMRQRIAQHALEELLNLLPYARINKAASLPQSVTTIDYFNQEKDELLSALSGELWDEESAKKYNQNTIESIKHLKSLGWDPEIGKNLTALLRSAQGKTPKGVSAMDLLGAEEATLRLLYSHDAFSKP